MKRLVPRRRIGAAAIRLVVPQVVAAVAAAAPLIAQGGDRRAYRHAADSTCLSGRACRLALVEMDEGRLFRSRVVVLQRGVGREAYVLGPAWERIAVSVGADAEAYARAHDAFAARARAGRRMALLTLSSLAVGMAAGAITMKAGEERYGLYTILLGPLVAGVVGGATGMLLAPWPVAASIEADGALEDAVAAWNRRVDPRVP